jgi:hypothetical protein
MFECAVLCITFSLGAFNALADNRHPERITPAQLKRKQLAHVLRPLESMSVRAPEDIVARGRDVLESGWFEDGEHWAMRPPCDWLRWKEEHRSRNFRLHSWNPVEPLMAAYTATRSQALLDCAIRVAEDWIEQHPYRTRVARARVTPFAWYDMAVGKRCIRLAYLVDLACRSEAVSDEVIQRLWVSLVEHMKHLHQDRNFSSHNNHGIYQVAGQLAAAGRFSWVPLMQQAEEQAQRRLQKMLEEHFTVDGVHKEHSPKYHAHVLILLTTLEQAGLVGGVPGFKALKSKAERALLWMIMPDGGLANFGDTDLRRALKLNDWASRGASQELQFVISKGQSGVAPDATAMGFPNSGYVALRSPWDATAPSWLAMQAAFHSRTHKHADDQSIIWFNRGQHVLVDAGKFGYVGGSPSRKLRAMGFWYADPRRVYVESNRAHNTIQVDDREDSRMATDEYGSALRRWGESDRVQYAEAEVVLLGSIVHNRLILTRHGQWLVVVDTLVDRIKRAHEYRQWFHFGPDFDVIQVDQRTVRGKCQDGPDLIAAELTGSASVQGLARGQEQPRMQGWWSPDDGVIEPIWSMHWTVDQSAATRLVTVFAFGDRLRSDTDQRLADPNYSPLVITWNVDGRDTTVRIDPRNRGDIDLSVREHHVKPGTVP